jgi:hypothetical protein
MRHIKTFGEKLDEAWNDSEWLTTEQIDWLNKCTRGYWEYHRDLGSVDVYGSFICEYQNLSDLKGVVFGEVTGSFNCYSNKFKNLIGFPRGIGGDLKLDSNNLESLEGSPDYIGGDYTIKNNKLKSLEKCTQEVGGFFSCSVNDLEDLVGAPKKVGNDFYCKQNKLTSLEGAPIDLKGVLECEDNPVSEKTLQRIYYSMKKNRISYEEALSSYWKWIPLEDQILLFRPKFKWISPEEAKNIEVIKRVRSIEGMI